MLAVSMTIPTARAQQIVGAGATGSPAKASQVTRFMIYPSACAR
jgi:hypothetical protein